MASSPRGKKSGSGITTPFTVGAIAAAPDIAFTFLGFVRCTPPGLAGTTFRGRKSLREVP